MQIIFRDAKSNFVYYISEAKSLGCLTGIIVLPMVGGKGLALIRRSSKKKNIVDR